MGDTNAKRKRVLSKGESARRLDAATCEAIIRDMVAARESELAREAGWAEQRQWFEAEKCRLRAYELAIWIGHLRGEVNRAT